MELTSLPKRPSLGQKGKSIKVKVNIFPITALRDAMIYQYDVKLSTAKFPATLSRAAFRQVELYIKKKYPNAWVVYDGAAIAYSSTMFEECSFSIIVDKNVEILIPPLAQTENSGSSGRGDRGGRGRGDRGGRGRGDRGGFNRGGPGRSAPEYEVPSSVLQPALILTETASKSKDFEKVTITIKPTTKVSMHELLLHSSGKAPESDSMIQASNALSAMINYIPSVLYTPVNTSTFFSPIGRTPITGGLEVWRGFHQSVKCLLAGHLGINVDVASTIFRAGAISLLDYACKVLNLRGIQDLSRISADVLNKALKGVNVVASHRGDQKQRFKIGSISKLTANSHKFEEGTSNKKISVADYFFREFKLRLNHPNLPLVFKVNGKTAFPMEVLTIVPAQRVTSRLNAMQTADVIKVTCQPPNDRKTVIEKAVKTTLAYSQNPYLKSIGLEVSSEMMTVPARVLPAPKVVFKGNSTLNGSDGAWNLRNQKLYNAPPLRSLGFCFFVRTDNKTAEQIRDITVQAWINAGMAISATKAPIVIMNPEGAGVRKGLQACFSQAQIMFKSRPDLIVCIISKDFPAVYEQIKIISLTEAGFVTQCMLWNNVFRGGRIDIKDQYIVNVALKANIKIGGSTNIIDRDLIADGVPTMFVGVDVTHPAPGSMAPSIAAIAISTDPKCTIFTTVIIQNEHRVELVDKIGQAILRGVREFQKKNQNRPPARIFVFRDGVSSGQFKQVLDVEIQSIKKSLIEKFKMTPKITCVVVQKRHHIRLFPMDASTSDRSGNCLPGTVIDSTITHPIEYNFVLQSHAGLQGTSRPTIYHVIMDENKMGSDAMQQLCYNLCFLSERATRSINMVAPCYRAHIAAFYARMFISGGESDTASMSSGGKSGGIGSGKLIPVLDGTQDTMYYM